MLNLTFAAKTFLLFGSLFLSLEFFSACNNVNSENLPAVKTSPTREPDSQSNDNRKEGIDNQLENDYTKQKAELNKQINDSHDDEIMKKIGAATEKKNYRELEEILASKPDLNVRTEEGNSLLVLMMSDVKAFEMLLEAGADPNFSSLKVGCRQFERCLKPPIYIAFEENNLAAMRLLLEHKIDPNTESVLAWAVSRGNKEMVDLFISYKADINFSEAVGKTGQTPIFFADDPKIAEILVKNGADVNHIDAEGLTPLMLAVENEDLKMVRFFLKNKVDVNFKNKEGQSPLEQSIAVGNKEITKALKLAGAK